MFAWSVAGGAAWHGITKVTTMEISTDKVSRKSRIDKKT
jgi:hypothetical protein